MYITFKTNMKTFEGGIQANFNTKRREELEDKATIELKKRYPEQCCIDKPGGIRINLKRNKSKKSLKKLLN